MSRRVYRCYFLQLETGYLQHVFNVFERVGYETGDALSDWSVLWSHVHPFTVLSRYTTNLKQHQKVYINCCLSIHVNIPHSNCLLKLNGFLLVTFPLYLFHGLHGLPLCPEWNSELGVALTGRNTTGPPRAAP